MGHTPGPWEIEPFLCGSELIVKDKSIIAAIGAVGPGEDADRVPLEQAHANARLIAASPKLLEACKKASQLRGMALELLSLDPSSEEANVMHAEMNNITAELWAVIVVAEGY